MSPTFWSERRILYRELCRLCEEIDNAISMITMISFSNNLYFICVQLLRSLKWVKCFTLGFLRNCETKHVFWFCLKAKCLQLLMQHTSIFLYSSCWVAQWLCRCIRQLLMMNLVNLCVFWDVFPKSRGVWRWNVLQQK